jgi:hypothetical protein
MYNYGKGKLFIERQDPKELVLLPNTDGSFVSLMQKVYEEQAGPGSWKTKNYFYLERGPYDIASVMDESVSSEPLYIKGPVIDMFDPQLPVLSEKIINPGQQSLLYDLNRLKEKNIPKVLCAASRVYDEEKNMHRYLFITKSPSNTLNVMRIYLPAKPLSVEVKNADDTLLENKNVWDELSQTCLLQFMNSSDGVKVEIRW